MHLCRLGDTSVGIAPKHRLFKSAPPISMIHLHQDEPTSLEAAEIVINAFGGELWRVIDPVGERNISFYMEGSRFSFDPNRIFTAAGRELTLRENSRYTMEAELEIMGLSNMIVDLILGSGKVVVAMHSNKGGDFSLESYRQGDLSSECANYCVGEDMDSHDFFITTSPRLFEAMAAENVNAVLQVDRPSDDGSLSVYCAQQGIPYVNVECKNAHLVEQVGMMSFLLDVINTL